MCKDTVTSTTSQVSCEINQSSVHTCDLCGRKFNSSFSLTVHTKVHDRITCIRERVVKHSMKVAPHSPVAFVALWLTIRTLCSGIFVRNMLPLK